MLNRRNISRLDVVDYISHGKNTAVQTEEVTEEAPKELENQPDFLTNLNNRALDGDIDPLIGREDTLERLFQVLGRRRKTTPYLLVNQVLVKQLLLKALLNASRKAKAQSFLKVIR